MRNLFLEKRLFYAGMLIVISFLLSWTIEPLFFVSQLGLALFVVLIIVDIVQLFSKKGIVAERVMADRFSNGDNNPVEIIIENKYEFKSDLTIVDEIPPIFQRRDLKWQIDVKAGQTDKLTYQIKPVKRGVYDFGSLNIFAKSPIQFFSRRFVFDSNKDVAVYPSYLQLRKYEIAAFAQKSYQMGLKKMRRIGHTMEFEQIKEYVQGDDPRFINWKATARRNDLMVNQYQEQRSQPIICIIDKGRAMKMPFENMTLLDYAINATLVISNIAIKKRDNAGVISFSNKMSGYLPPNRRSNQMYKIQEFLYAQKTNYKETNIDLLQHFIHVNVKRRSLLLFFTNFESVSSMRRQLPYLRILAKRHLLVVVFFRNTELKKLLNEPAYKMRKVFTKVIAEKQYYDKNKIVKELKMNGIYSILTTPKNLTIDTINKYLEIKAKGLI
jgi:uncharacterized protein (DUF58 family)